MQVGECFSLSVSIDAVRRRLCGSFDFSLNGLGGRFAVFCVNWVSFCGVLHEFDGTTEHNDTKQRSPPGPRFGSCAGIEYAAGSPPAPMV